MKQKTGRLYPSAPSIGSNHDLEQRSENKLNDATSFNNHIININEMITYCKDKNQKPKKIIKNYETPNTKLESVNTIVIIGATSTSVTVSITRIGLIILQISGNCECPIIR